MNEILYVIMRNDLASLNSGKAMAQAVHAGNAFETRFDIEMQLSMTGSNEIDHVEANKLATAFHEWKRQTPQGFGTTIVLSGAIKDIKTAVDMLKKMGYFADIVHDPTYPLLDGDVVHLIPLDTCAYVFLKTKDSPIAQDILSNFNLHP